MSILILEDNLGSRFTLRALLEENGYRVVEAADEKSAIEICRQHGSDINLLIADVMLRSTEGPRTVKQVRELRPNLPILFVSGFPLETLVNRGLLRSTELAHSGVRFLRKPFDRRELLGAVRALATTEEEPKGRSEKREARSEKDES